jgi:hypothetical protein
MPVSSSWSLFERLEPVAEDAPIPFGRFDAEVMVWVRRR